MKDPFERLPAEVQASIFVADIFGNYPSEAVGTLVSRLPEELQPIIRAVVVIFSRWMTGHNLITDLEDDDPGLPISDKTENLLPSDLLSSVKSLVSLGCRIQDLTTSFLDTHIERVNSLQPMHLLRPGYMFDYEHFKNYPEGRRYTVPKTWGPSWIEQYRVVRSLWRLQLYYTLTNVSARSVSVDHLDAMLISHPDEALLRIWGHLKPWELDEIDCVHDYLGQVNISLGESEYKVSIQHASLPSHSFEMDTATAATILLDPPSAATKPYFCGIKT